MAIADTITSMYENVGNVYDVLELAGADLTNVDKNIENLKQSWEERLLYFLANGTDVVWNNWLPKVTGTGETITLNNTIEAKMDFIYKGNTSQTGTPTPDTPIPVQVVSGDNTIKVEGKNLFNKDNPNIIHKQPLQDGNIDTNSNYVATYLPAKEGDVFTIFTTSNLFDNYAKIWFISENPATATTWLSRISRNSGETSITATAPQNTKYVCFYMIYSNNQTTINSLLETIQVEKSNEATTYEAYQSQTYPINLGNIELCKIGTYQDKIAKSTGKNLLDYSTCVIGDINGSTGQEETQAMRIRSDFIKIEPSTSYVSSLVGGQYTTFFYTENKTYIAGGGASWINSGTSFTTPSNAKYVRLKFWKGQNTAISLSDLKNVMFNIGTIALEYEPYGKVWYLNKQIGKVVLNGSENWSLNESGTGYSRYTITNNTATTNYSDTIVAMSDKFIGSKDTDVINADADANRICIVSNHRFIIKTIDNNLLTLQAFKTWLSAHNTIVYYVLATPTYEEITDTTLISQLEAIKKSYNTQTNISQTNADKPFILDVVALGELEI